ncbi:MAG: hypothetical protein WBD27_01530 [Pyrinomonadaceae bacterium]
MGENYFLTELDKLSFAKKFILSLHGFGLALFFFCLALVATFLSYFSASHCFWLKATSPTEPRITETILMGYWGELNAAPLYLIVVPIIIFLYCRFLSSLHTAFTSLEESGVLRSKFKDENSLVRLGEKNRRIFRKVCLIGIIFSLYIVIGNELISILQTRDKLSNETSDQIIMGYVQSQFFESWAARVSNSDSLKRQIPSLKDRNDWSIQPMPPDRISGSLVFAIFLVTALILQTLMVFLSFWLGLKILFFFWETWNFLPTADPEAGNSRSYARIMPNFYDEKRRYGLCEIDSIYRQVLWILVFIGIGLIANFSNNYSKATFFEISGDTNWLSLSGQVFIFVSPIFVFVVFIFLPLLIFRNSMEKVREKELKALNKQIKESQNKIDEKYVRLEKSEKPTDEVKGKKRSVDKLRLEIKGSEDDLTKLVGKKNLVNEQTTYPSGDKVFISQIVLLFVLLIVMPLAIVANVATDKMKNTIIGQATEITGSVDLAKEMLKSACGCR